MKIKVMTTIWYGVYANDNDALIPELWAQESLAILEENMVIGNLIHRDFSPMIAQFGDVVHTRKPAEFKGKRKTNDDSVTIQDASSTNIPVTLNQHIHTSFMIKDGEESKAFKDLVAFYLRPAMLAQARFLDQVLLGQVYRFQSYYSGKLGTDVDEAALLDLREIFNINKMSLDNRHLILTPKSETALLKVPNFVQADRVGDDGTALREASLGRKYGFNLFMCQNMSYVATGNTTTTGAINNASGYPAGTTAITVNGFSAAITNGTYFTVAGDATPYRVVSTVGGAAPTSITFTPALRRAVVHTAVVTTYTPGAVNSGPGYAAGYAKEITVSGFTVAPKVGQLIAFGDGATTAYYSVLEATTTSVLLDRPLDVAIANADKVNVGPAGSYNFGFQRNAVALVSRPLAPPKSGTGALSSLASYNGFGMRAVITYSGEKQGHLVTLDVLAGVAVLDSVLGGVMFG